MPNESTVGTSLAGHRTRSATLSDFNVRSLFPGLSRVLYFNTASYAVGATPVRDALRHSVDAWVDGTLRWEDTLDATNSARALFARIVNATHDAIALVPYVSTAAGVVAAQFPPARHGENVLVPENEFSSNYYPWLLLRERGYDVRRVAAIDGALPPVAFAKYADGGTRLIAVSAVQAATGYRLDLPAISEVARQSGAWLFVDGAQAVGAVDIDVMRDGIDFLAVPSHKYLLGTRGMGYLYVRGKLLSRMTPILAGWHAAPEPLNSFFGPEMVLSKTASKLDTSQAWFSAFAEPHALAILDRFGIAQVVQRNRQLTQYLYEQLGARGLLAHAFHEANRSPIVTLRLNDATACVAHLAAIGAVVGLRQERIRLSVHFYNTESEIDRVIALIKNYFDRSWR